MNHFVEYLNRAITDKMPLESIVDVFEQMCKMPMENDMILFETGTFSFTGEPLFYFSLTRQFPNEEEEFYQIVVNILYKPTDENKAFHDTIWSEDVEENIFDYIRKSQVFAYAKNDEYIRIEIYMDET